MISSRDFTGSSCSMATVVVTGHSSRRSTPPRWTPTGNGLQRGQLCWPPLGRTVGRQRAATWPPLGRISWPPTPIIRSWALTRGYALHPGTRNRYMMRCTRIQHRPSSRQVNYHDGVSGTHRTHQRIQKKPPNQPRQNFGHPHERQRTAASNCPSETLRRTHQRISKSRLTSHDRVSGTHSAAETPDSCPSEPAGQTPPAKHRHSPTSELSHAPGSSCRKTETPQHGQLTASASETPACPYDAPAPPGSPRIWRPGLPYLFFVKSPGRSRRQRWMTCSPLPEPSAPNRPSPKR